MILWCCAEGCKQRSGKLQVMKDYDSKPHKPIRFEVQCRNRTQIDEVAESTEASSWSKRVKSTVSQRSPP